jgi:hypothetical protein
MQQKLCSKGFGHKKKLPVLSECAYIPEIFIWNQYTLCRVSVIVIWSSFGNLDLQTTPSGGPTGEIPKHGVL